MSQDPFDDLILDEDFIASGQREASADERIARAARIARANDRLRAEGEISDGSGKPGGQRRPLSWVAIGAGIAVTIVVVVLLLR